MAATNAYVNSSGWQFQITNGAMVPITRVKDWSLPRGISRIRESADYDHFFTLNICDFEDPTVQLTSLDAFVAVGIPPTAFGVLSGVVRDANNGATSGGGAKQLVLTNAALADESSSGSHRQYARGTLHFCGTSADGVTSPLGITAL